MAEVQLNGEEIVPKVSNPRVGRTSVIACSQRRHGQDKTVLSCLLLCWSNSTCAADGE